VHDNSTAHRGNHRGSWWRIYGRGHRRDVLEHLQRTMKGKQMTDLTKIEKPYGLCTQEEQEGFDALKTFPCSLQVFCHSSVWNDLTFTNSVSLSPAVTYRQNPNWQPPTLDVPDWFWENTDFNYVAMDPDQSVRAFKDEPCKSKSRTRHWVQQESIARLDKTFTRHNFNPHGIPWDKSLTVRPGLEE
jgi:hypothetical protein